MTAPAVNALAARAAASPLLPLGVAAVGIAAALAALPFLAELPVNLEYARTLAKGAQLAVTAEPYSTPVGYPLLLTPFVALWNTAGVTAVQAAVYAALCWAMWRLMADTVTSPWLALFCVLAIGWHPYVLLNIQRVNESAVTVLFSLLLVRWMTRDAAWRGTRAAVAFGLVLGGFVAMRGNAPALAILPVLAWWLTGRAAPPLGKLLLGFGIALVVYGAAVWAATGTPAFWPRNGPYNLACGFNDFAAETILARQNGEPSLPPALAKIGIRDADPRTVEQAVYVRMARDFVFQHPWEATKLVGIKLMVLFSPRLFNADSAFEVAVQSALLFPVVLWAVAMGARIFRFGAGRREWLYMAYVALFTLPFLLTNSDPRFRLPLDVAMLAMALVLFDSLRRGAAQARR